MVIEKANGVALLVELLRLGVSGDSGKSDMDKVALDCIAVSATRALKGLAADSTANQVRVLCLDQSTRRRVTIFLCAPWSCLLLGAVVC